MGLGFLRGILIGGTLLCRVAESASNAQIVPGSKCSCDRPQQAQKEIANIAIGPRIADENGIVGIPGLLPPCVEDCFFKTVVGMQSRDYAIGRVVEQHRTDTRLPVELKKMAGGKERFVLANWLAFVVENCPATGDPARRNVIPHIRHRPPLGSFLVLCFPAKTV